MPLTPKQERYASAVAAGLNRKEAAEAAGISQRQARDWLKANPEIRDRIGELSERATGYAVAILTQNLAEAALALAELLKPENPPQVRLNAARAIIADYVSLKTFADLEAKLERIQSRMAKFEVLRSA